MNNNAIEMFAVNAVKDSIAVADTLSRILPLLPAADSLAAADTVAPKILTPEEIKEAEKAAAKAEKEKKKAAKIAAQ